MVKSIKYYHDMYSNLVDLAYDEYVKEIGDDDNFDSSEVIFANFGLFDLGEFSNIEAQVGNNIYWNGDRALDEWIDNTKNDKLNEIHLEVDRILRLLFKQ